MKKLKLRFLFCSSTEFLLAQTQTRSLAPSTPDRTHYQNYGMTHLSRLPVAIIQAWYQREGYIKSIADFIEKELQIFPNPKEAMIFFRAHGVPISYIKDAGDPYKDQMEECIFLIMKELRSRTNDDHTLAYQVMGVESNK